jgi:hypothetical protein
MVDYAEVDRKARQRLAYYERVGAKNWMPWGTPQDAYLRSVDSWYALFDGWGEWFEHGDELI